MKFQSITLSAIALCLTLPVLTFPLLGLPVLTLPVLTLPVLTPPVLKRALTLPVLTPPVLTPPVLTPPINTLPVLTPPVLTPPVLTPPVLTPRVLKKRTQVPVNLGTAATFGVLGASTVTSTGNTVITGDIGVFPGSSITGFPPGVYTGSRYNAGAVAGKAQQDSTTAYNTAAGLAPTVALPNSDLGGLTLSPGVYTFPTPIVELTTNLTLDAGLNSTAQFVFQIENTFSTAALAQVLLVNGALPCNVFWVVGVSATLATQTAFQGILLAVQGIAVKAGVSNVGSLIALNAAVTLIDNNLKSSPCVSNGGGGGGGTTTLTTSVIHSATLTTSVIHSATPTPILSVSAIISLLPR